MLPILTVFLVLLLNRKPSRAIGEGSPLDGDATGGEGDAPTVVRPEAGVALRPPLPLSGEDGAPQPVRSPVAGDPIRRPKKAPALVVRSSPCGGLGKEMPPLVGDCIFGEAGVMNCGADRVLNRAAMPEAVSISEPIRRATTAAATCGSLMPRARQAMAQSRKQ